MLACLAVAIFALVYPLYVIWPFRAQGTRELVAALAVLRWRPLAMGICVGIAGAAAVGYWRAGARVRAVLGLAGVLVCAGLARVNIYEKMFHPMARPVFETAGAAKLDGDEKVIAVAIGAEARAYPIRSMSYHHIVNDAVGRVPIVATY